LLALCFPWLGQLRQSSVPFGNIKIDARRMRTSFGLGWRPFRLVKAIRCIVQNGWKCHLFCPTLAPYVASALCGHGRLSIANVMAFKKFHKICREMLERSVPVERVMVWPWRLLLASRTLDLFQATRPRAPTERIPPRCSALRRKAAPPVEEQGAGHPWRPGYLEPDASFGWRKRQPRCHLRPCRQP
jgi:hypothetical protein